MLRNNNIIILFFLLTSLIQSQDCNYYNYNTCNNEVFFDISDEIDKKTFDKWRKKNKSELSNYFEGKSNIKVSKDGLVQEARSSLASQISVDIRSSITKSASEFSNQNNIGSFSQSISTDMAQTINARIQDYKQITVLDKGTFTVYAYKCKRAYYEEQCDYNERLLNEISVLERKIIKSNDVNKDAKLRDYNETMRYRFELLIKGYLYTYSSSNSELRDKNNDFYNNIKEIASDIKEIISTSYESINFIPFINYDQSIDLMVENIDFHQSYIEGFPMYAFHNNGLSDWNNNIQSGFEISNGRTSFNSGMLLSQSSNQFITIHPDHFSYSEKLKSENSEFVITDAAIKSLSKIIAQENLLTIRININKQLPLKLKFSSNFKSAEKNKVIQSINEVKNISDYFCMCDGDINSCSSDNEAECFQMEFEKIGDNKGNIYLRTPDNKKTKSTDFKIKSSGLARSSSKIKGLYSGMFKSQIRYNFCDQIRLKVNGSSLDNDDKIKTVSNGPVDIQIDYRYKGDLINIYTNQLIISNDKDLNDLVIESDLFEFEEGQKVCYSDTEIDYKINFSNYSDDDYFLSGLKIIWNDKNYLFDGTKFTNKKGDQEFGNPFLIKQNSLKKNTLKIKKNGYLTLKDDNIRASLNYRGVYPIDKTLEINPVFGSNNLKEAGHYVVDLFLPGKAQNQYYTNSFMSKIRSIIVGLGAYYFAYEAFNTYDNYTTYNSEYLRLLDLYNSSTSSEDILFYKNETLKNQTLSNQYREETLQFGLISGVLFSLNAIEVTILHLEF